MAGVGRKRVYLRSVINGDRHPELDAPPQKSDLFEVAVAPGTDQPVQAEFQIFGEAKPAIH